MRHCGRVAAAAAAGSPAIPGLAVRSLASFINNLNARDFQDTEGGRC